MSTQPEEDDPWDWTAEELARLTPEEFDLLVRVLQAERMDRSAADAEQAAQAESEGKSRYVRDPVGWAQDVRGIFLWSKQQEILRALVDHPRVAVKSCHGVGKTLTAGGVAIPWWIDVHPLGSARVLSTAPSNDQVRALLWHEVNRAHAAGGLPGHTNQTEWWIDGTMVAFGRKPADTKPGAMVGMHSEFNLVVLDEADGVADALWTAADALATNDDSRILAIGNPDTAGGRFEQACKPGSGWHVITISAFDSPNFTDEPVPDLLRRVLVAPSFEAKMRQDHGVDSPTYRSKVLGEFPKQSANAIVRERDLEKARTSRPIGESSLFPVELGVDVAAGGDKSVIRLRRGVRFGSDEDVWVWRSQHDDSERLVDEICEAQLLTGATSIKIDANGVGWGIAGAVRKKLRKQQLRTGRICAVHPVLTGMRASDPKRFKNLRAELWWMAREMCDSEVWDFSFLDPNDPVLEELKAPQWHQDAGKRIVVEDKAEIRKRLGRSPDDADALLLAYYTPPVTTEQLVPQGRWAHVPARR